MEEPIVISNDDLRCPVCRTRLVEGKSPYYLHGTKVGEFDSLLCEICHYSLLTEKGYEESGIKAKEMGLLNDGKETPDLEERTIAKVQNTFTGNKSNIEEMDDEGIPESYHERYSDSYPEITIQDESEKIFALVSKKDSKQN